MNARPRLPRVRPERDRMTRRACAYMWVTAVILAGIGGICVLEPESLSSGSFDGLRDALPGVHGDDAMVAWGVIYLIVAVGCVHAAIVRSETPARAALVLTVVVEGFWFGGFISAGMGGTLVTPLGLFFMGGLIAKDVIALWNPLRNPFEPVEAKLAVEVLPHPPARG